MGREQYSEEHLISKEPKSAIVVFTDYFSFLAVLNSLWILSSLLVFPIFSATEAVFYCISKKLMGRTVSWRLDYMGYVKNNMWISFKRGWPFLIIFTLLIVDGMILIQMPDDLIIRPILMGALAVLSVLTLFICFYSYSYLVMTHLNARQRIMKSFLTTIKQPHYSAGIVIILIAQLGLSLFFVPLFFFFSLSFPVFLFLYAVHKIDQKSKN